MPATTSSDAWTPLQAAHLLSRAGFGGSPDSVSSLYSLGRRAAVERLLAGDEDADIFPPPQLTPVAEAYWAFRQANMMAEGEEKRETLAELRRAQEEQLRAVRAWWLQRMRYSRYPLREKMTLFWHGHFATSFDKVNSANLMYQQNETLRTHALGNFNSLTKDISRDPAMMRYLDLNRSEAKRPNENFARELMELFTLGEGVRYTEVDVREAARALTGYRMTPASGAFRYQPKAADLTEKTFLGQTGNWNGDDVIDIICQQRECAAFISRKIWVYLAGTEPGPDLQARLTRRLLDEKYEIKPLLREILLSPEFSSPEVVRHQVKSPVQWLVQISQSLEAPLPPPNACEFMLRSMGQVLFAPPNVKGWAGGRAWINGSTYLLRCNLAGTIAGADDKPLEKSRDAIPVEWDRIAPAEMRKNPDALCDSLAFRFLNVPLEPADRQKVIAFLVKRGPDINDATMRDCAHLIMSTPEFQLT